MKKIIVSSLASVALAMPLGIVGLTITAPVAATNAEAQSFLSPQSRTTFQPPPSGIPSGIDVLEVLRHYQVGRCTVHQLWDCDASVVSHVAGDFRGLFDFFDFDYSVAFPEGSNGANQITFDTLAAESRDGAGTRGRRDLIDRYLQTVFSNQDIDPIFTYQTKDRGYISPDDRERYEREIDQLRREEAHRRFVEERQARAEALARACLSDPNCDLSDLDEILDETGLQITPIEPLGSLAEIEEITDHRQATSDNRARIVELQEEVTMHEDTLQELEPAVGRNVQVIEALGNSVGVLSEAVTDLAEDTARNAAGIALAYALDTPGLSYGKRFAITGALGQFRGESAVGFSGTFKAGEFVLISVGGGFAGSGDSSVNGGKVSATYEW